MAAAIAGLGRQFVEGYDAARRALGGDAGAGAPASPARPDGVAVCGMGGSAIGGELVLATAGELAVPASVVRGYDLPAWVRPATLVVAVSYSGETEETLACVEAALSRGCRPVCVASGGRLAAIAAAEGLPAVSVPAGLQPRAALGVLATPVAAALAHAGLCADLTADVGEAGAVLDQLASDLAPEVPEEANGAKALARRLAGRLVLALRRRRDGAGRSPLEDAGERERQGAGLLGRAARARPQRDRGVVEPARARCQHPGRAARGPRVAAPGSRGAPTSRPPSSPPTAPGSSG